jgi:uncharacterized membrane protein
MKSTNEIEKIIAMKEFEPFDKQANDKEWIKAKYKKRGNSSLSDYLFLIVGFSQLILGYFFLFRNLPVGIGLIVCAMVFLGMDTERPKNKNKKNEI